MLFIWFSLSLPLLVCFCAPKKLLKSSTKFVDLMFDELVHSIMNSSQTE